MSSRAGAVLGPRFRQCLTWAGTLTFVGLLAVTIFSREWGIGWGDRTQQHMFRVAAGFIGYSAQGPFGLRPGWQVYEHSWSFQHGLEVRMSGMGAPRTLYIPLWIPMVMVGLPTAVLWCTSRRNVARSLPRGFFAALGIGVTTLLAVAWAVSATSVAVLNVAGVRCEVGGGKLTLSPYVPPPAPTRIQRRGQSTGIVTNMSAVPAGEFTESTTTALGLVWPSFERGKVSGYSVGIPLWILLLLVAIPAIVFWFRAHSVPPGHCGRCGYDLTGNVSGRCPECGTVLARGASQTLPN